MLWNMSSWEAASPSVGDCTTGVQRARKAVVEGEGGQCRATKRPHTATTRFPLCCSRKALDVRISLTKVTSAGKQTVQSGSGAPSLCSQQGWPWLSNRSQGPEQSGKIHEMPAEASLTPARLLLGKEELLVHIVSHLSIQDVKDRVPLGKQLHLTKRGLPSGTVPVSVGPGWHRGCRACWSHSPASAGAACCACNKGTRMGMGTVTANAQ